MRSADPSRNNRNSEASNKSISLSEHNSEKSIAAVNQQAAATGQDDVTQNRSKCNSFLAKDTFLQKYAIALAVTCFLSYTPFFNLKLITTLDSVFWGEKKGVFGLSFMTSHMNFIQTVAYLNLNLNAVVNPIIFIYLRQRAKYLVSQLRSVIDQ